MVHRHPESPYIKSVRAMTREDLPDLREKSSRVVLTKVRDSHHKIARLLATGMSQTEVARVVGYSISRVCLLANSPAMAELIAKYRSVEDESWKESRDEYYDYVYAAGLKSWRMINEQLDSAEESGETIPLRELRGVADSSGDRVGYHKKTSRENINIDFAARLEAAIHRSSKARIIEHEE